MSATLLKLRSWVAPDEGDPETPPPPPPPAGDAPSSLAVTNSTDEIDLGWVMPAGSETSTSTVYRALTSSGPWERLATVGTGESTYTDRELGTGMSRAYYVTATTADGVESGRSGIVNATQISSIPYTVVGLDSFTAETPDIALTGHSGETGWTLAPYSTGTPKLSSQNRVYGLGSSSQLAVAYSDDVPTSADYDVSTTIVPLTGSNRSGPVGRLDTSDTTGGTYYHARYYQSLGSWQLWLYVNGVGTQLGGDYPEALTLGQPYVCTLRMQGSTIQCLVNGVVRISATNTRLPAIGRAGIRLFGSGGATSGLQQDNFIIEQGVATPDTTAPAAPTGLAVAATSSGNNLTWVNPDDPDFARVRVYRAPRSGGPYTRISAGQVVTGTSWFDGDVVAGSTYVYALTSLDAIGNESPFTADVSVTAAGAGSDDINAITTTATTLTLSATFNSIALVLTYSGDPNYSSTVTCEIAEGAGSYVSRDNVMWRPVAVGGVADAGRYLGRIERLAPNTTYHVRLTVDDADGVNGLTTFEDSITTRDENIPDAADVDATHYLDGANGDDANDGTTGHPWKTATHMWKNAPSGAVVECAAGFYITPLSTRTTPIMVKAASGAEAVDDTGAIINAGNHVVFESLRGSCPTGTGEDTDNAGLVEAPWVALTAGTVIDGYTLPSTVWTWPAETAVASNVGQLFVAATRDATPQRVSVSGTDEPTDGARIEYLLTNPRYHYGIVRSVSGTAMYLSMPPYATAMDPDPNNLYWTVGKDSGFVINCSGPPEAATGATVRLSGLEIRVGGNAPYLNKDSQFCIIDHNHIILGSNGVYMTSQRSPVVTGSDTVIQYNHFTDSSLRAQPGGDASPAAGLIPWSWIKFSSKGAKASETTAIRGNMLHDRLVVRYNVFDGPFNVIGNSTSGFTGTGPFHQDIHDNIIRNIADDLFEYESGAMCVGVWNNQCSHFCVFYSLAPSQYGPHHVFGNTSWMFGAAEVPERADGGPKGPHGNLFKVSLSNMYLPILRVVGNTFWSSDPESEGWNKSNGGFGSYPYVFRRNDIIRAGYRPWDREELAGKWDEDVSWLAYSEPDGAVKAGTTETSQPLVYITLPGVGDNINRGADDTYYLFSDSATIDAQFVDAAAGDLRLVEGSILIDAGIAVENFTTGTKLGSEEVADE